MDSVRDQFLEIIKYVENDPRRQEIHRILICILLRKASIAGDTFEAFLENLWDSVTLDIAEASKTHDDLHVPIVFSLDSDEPPTNVLDVIRCVAEKLPSTISHEVNDLLRSAFSLGGVTALPGNSEPSETARIT